MGVSKVVHFTAEANDTSVTYNEGKTMLALIDDFETNVTSYGDEGYTTPDSNNTGYKGYESTKWMIGTFILTIRIDQNSNYVVLLPSLVLPFTGQCDMANVSEKLVDVGDEIVEEFTLKTTKGTQLVEGKASAYVKKVDDELQIWGHVDATSNHLGDVKADLYFAKVWQSSSTSGSSSPVGYSPASSPAGSPAVSPVGGVCTCTKFKSCGCRMYTTGPPGITCTCFS